MPLRGGTVVMVEPGERHRVVFVDPQVGARWVAIKERSEPNSKHVASSMITAAGAGIAPA